MEPSIKAIIIHGNAGGTGNTQWLGWLAEELGKRGIPAVSPTFPDNFMARRSVWLPYIEKLGADEHTILVGYSSGAVAAMRYAETHKIRGSVLVGACHTDLGSLLEKVSGYYKDPWQWDAIKENQGWIAQFGSVDDPVIPIKESRFVHEKLGSEYAEFPDRQHFGYPTPMAAFPEALDAILRHERP